MGSSPRPAWRRLGQLLTQRRPQIDPRFHKREEFATSVGISKSVIRDIENGSRDNFSTSMLSAIEAAYQWQPGSIQAVLDGGDPTPASPTVRISGVWASTEPVANVPVDEELRPWIDDAHRHEVDVQAWDLTEPLERELFVHHVFSWPAKIEMRGVLRAYMADARERARRENGQAAANGAP